MPNKVVNCVHDLYHYSNSSIVLTIVWKYGNGIVDEQHDEPNQDMEDYNSDYKLADDVSDT